MQIVDQLQEFLGNTGESLAWKHSPITEKLVTGLKSAVAAAQDAWLEGHLQGAGKELAQVAEQAAANMLAQVVFVIENIKLPEKQEQENG